MTSIWEEGQLTRRRPAQADAVDDDVDVGHTTRIPARSHYIPIAQREPLLSSRPVLVQDLRQGRRNRYPPALSPRAVRPTFSQPQQQRPAQQVRLPLSRGRQTQDDPVYQRQQQPRAYQDRAPREEEEEPEPRRRGRRHWLFYMGLGMGAMLVLWYLLTALISWGLITWNDWHYGRPRTFQCDAIVGHNDSAANPSHFLALNFNHQVEIIEFPGEDTTKAKIYLGPPLVGPGEELAVVTLSFRDVNGDGKPDMIVTIEGSRVVFINDRGQFRPLKVGEHVHL
jgi:hypothetical protein